MRAQAVRGVRTVTTQRITSISRARFQELRQQLIDGTLSSKWDGLTPTRKADIVEEKQIRGMAMIFELPKDQRAILDTDQWSELHIVKDRDLLKLEIVSR